MGKIEMTALFTWLMDAAGDVIHGRVLRATVLGLESAADYLKERIS